jgi:nicotinamidase-related amidase
MDLTLDAASTALVMIDLQKGIARGTAPHAADDVVARAATIAAALRAAGGTVIWVRVENAADGADRLKPVTDSGRGGGGPKAADHSELAPRLGVLAGDVVVTKRGWGAFYGTDLDLQLRRRGIGTIILGGISTNIGVESTAREAYDHAYQQVFVEDAMACRSAAEHAVTVETILPRIGRVRSTAQILEALSANGAGPE